MTQAQGPAHFIGVARQTADINTPVTTGFNFLPMKAGGVSRDRPSKASDELYGYEPRWLRAQNSSVSGSLPLLLYYSQIGRFLDNAFVRATTENAASYVVDATNNKIYFTRSSTPYTGTIASASYTSGTLATAIAAAMNAADAGQSPDYTASYSTTTKKWTIAASGGTAFVLNLSTLSTPIWTTIGFTGGVDTSSATTHTGATAAPTIYTHLWTPDLTGAFDDTIGQQNGLTILDHRDLFTYSAAGCMVNSVQVAYAENDPHAPGITFGVKGVMLERVSAVTPTFALDVPATPDGSFGIDIGYAGVNHAAFPVKQLQLQITPGVDLRWQIGSTEATRAIRTGKIQSQLSFAWDLEDLDTGGGVNLNEPHEDAWIDPDETADITIAQIGEVIRGALTERMDITLPAMRPTGGTSQAEQGTIAQPYAFMGGYDVPNDDAGIQISLVSTEVLP